MFNETVEQLRLFQRGCCVTSSGTGLVKAQHDFLDFAGMCLSEASISGDDAKAALLEDAPRPDVVVGNPCVERPRRIDSQEGVRAQVALPLPTRGRPTQYVTSRSPGSPHDLIVPATSPSTTMTRLITVSSALSLVQRRSNACRSM